MSEVTTVQVFDPAMCCSTGVCGPAVDPQLVRFAADLDWLRGQGFSVERFNLAQQPGAFASEPLARQLLQEKGEEGLPLIVIEGRALSSGHYPTREELAGWVGLDTGTGSAGDSRDGMAVGTAGEIWTDHVAELVAISASVASNCVACLSAHEQRARSMDVSEADIGRAVAMGRAVREAAAERVLTLAERLAKKRTTALPVSNASPCCDPAGGDDGPSPSGCC